MGRNAIEVSLAKPLSDKRKQAQVKREQRKPHDAPINQRNNYGYSFNNAPPSGKFGGFHNNPSPRGGGRSEAPFSMFDFPT